MTEPHRCLSVECARSHESAPTSLDLYYEARALRLAAEESDFEKDRAALVRPTLAEGNRAAASVLVADALRLVTGMVIDAAPESMRPDILSTRRLLRHALDRLAMKIDA